MNTKRIELLAVEFDKHRHCGWNNSNIGSDYNSPELAAAAVPEYESLGSDCYGTLMEIALLHTLRPCKNCGGEYLYKSVYQISCCVCFGSGECKDCKNGGCGNVAENMNLPDAITRWNLWFGDTGPRGRVKVIG